MNIKLLLNNVPRHSSKYNLYARIRVQEERTRSARYPSLFGMFSGPHQPITYLLFIRYKSISQGHVFPTPLLTLVCLPNQIKAISWFQIPEEGSPGTLAGGMKKS
jgi:hypothetical protein